MTNTRSRIVDLEGGDQAPSDERGRYWVMLNGEIYLRRAARGARGARHVFASTSDTEVIAHAFEEWATVSIA